MSNTNWAKDILRKAKREDKKQEKKRIKRLVKRQAKRLIKVAGTQGIPTPEASKQN
jgi:hypothetical protein